MTVLKFIDVAGGYNNIFNTADWLIVEGYTKVDIDLTFGVRSELKTVLIGERKKLKVWMFEGKATEKNNYLSDKIFAPVNFQDDKNVCLVSQWQEKLNITLIGYINENL